MTQNIYDWDVKYQRCPPQKYVERLEIKATTYRQALSLLDQKENIIHCVFHGVRTPDGEYHFRPGLPSLLDIKETHGKSKTQS